MVHRASAIAFIAVVLALAAGACGGGEEAPATLTPVPSPEVTRPAVAPSPTSQPAASPTSQPTPSLEPEATSPAPTAQGTTAPPSAPEASPAAVPPEPGAAPRVTVEEARDKLARASLLLEDLPAGFTTLSEDFLSNEDAAQAPGAAPDAAELFAQCGRLLGRTASYLAGDPESAALAGDPVSYFSNVTVYQTAEGATSCFQETIRRGAEGRGGSIGRQFGELFIDPDNVEVAVVDFPAIGEQSLALTVSGETDADGLIVGVVVLVVSFRQGPTTASVGAVRVVLPPDQGQVEPFVRLVAQRLQEEFGP